MKKILIALVLATFASVKLEAQGTLNIVFPSVLSSYDPNQNFNLEVDEAVYTVGGQDYINAWFVYAGGDFGTGPEWGIQYVNGVTGLTTYQTFLPANTTTVTLNLNTPTISGMLGADVNGNNIDITGGDIDAINNDLGGSGANLTPSPNGAGGYNFQIAAVPEPTNGVFFCLGAVLLILLSFTRRFPHTQFQLSALPSHFQRSLPSSFLSTAQRSSKFCVTTGSNRITTKPSVTLSAVQPGVKKMVTTIADGQTKKTSSGNFNLAESQ